MPHDNSVSGMFEIRIERSQFALDIAQMACLGNVKDFKYKYRLIFLIKAVTSHLHDISIWKIIGHIPRYEFYQSV